jgi:hypothetical protein
VKRESQGDDLGSARPGAGHEGAGDRDPLVFVVMGKFAEPSGYHEPSALNARRRIVSFFRTHLT